VTLANPEDPYRRIFVLTLSEIEALTSCADLRNLLMDKSRPGGSGGLLLTLRSGAQSSEPRL
jgi:hypothetical protein